MSILFSTFVVEIKNISLTIKNSKSMKYRAKITGIEGEIENLYNTNMYNIVKDKKDRYIEVDDIDEAEHIEKMQKAAAHYRELKYQLIAKYNRR